MFEGIEICDYQNHVQRRIKLDPQVTTIVGPSDKGKSAIIRALMWVCLNKPNGVEYIRTGATDAKVRVLLDGGRRLMRARGKSLGNIYRLDGQEYAALNGQVPQDIAALLGVTDDNFQLQLDSPYWLADKPGDVAKQLNAIVNLEIIDASTNWLAAEHRRAVIIDNEAQERLARTQDAHNKAGASRAMVADAKALQARFNAATAARATADSLVGMITSIQDQQSVTVYQSGKARDAAQVLALMTKARDARKAAAGLAAVVAAHQATLAARDRALPAAAWAKVVRLYDQAVAARTAANILRLLIDSAKSHTADATAQQGIYDTTKRKLPKECPTCGKPIK